MSSENRDVFICACGYMSACATILIVDGLGLSVFVAAATGLIASGARMVFEATRKTT